MVSPTVWAEQRLWAKLIHSTCPVACEGRGRVLVFWFQGLSRWLRNFSELEPMRAWWPKFPHVMFTKDSPIVLNGSPKSVINVQFSNWWFRLLFFLGLEPLVLVKNGNPPEQLQTNNPKHQLEGRHHGHSVAFNHHYHIGRVQSQQFRPLQLFE